jgi:plastocyanin
VTCRPCLPLRVLALGFFALLSATTVACGGGDAAASHDGPPPDGDAVVAAQATAFAPTTIDLPSGRDVVVVLDNLDKGVAHNIRFPDAPGNPKTALKNGPIYQTLTVHFDTPGTYAYVCDLHPAMRGTATVS